MTKLKLLGAIIAIAGSVITTQVILPSGMDYFEEKKTLRKEGK